MFMPPSVGQETALARHDFAEDVAYYLSLTPRQLPSRYLYDALGSSLFDAICRLPWYHLERTERCLLARHGDDILAAAAPLTRLVEFGPGGGAKLATLLARSVDTRAMSIHLIDVSAAALAAAMERLRDVRSLDVVPHHATYEDGLMEVSESERGAGRTLTVFLGSNIGNFDPTAANAFLTTIRASLLEGDMLLLGTDLVRDEGDLIAAYDDPLGVTAAFNRNLLVRANRELGADFAIENFAHRAVWNADASRIEMHLVSRGRQRVRVPASDLDVCFEADEIIWTESSYKYRPSGVRDMLQRAGFGTVDQWVQQNFALTLCEAIDPALNE